MSTVDRAAFWEHFSELVVALQTRISERFFLTQAEVGNEAEKIVQLGRTVWEGLTCE